MILILEMKILIGEINMNFILLIINTITLYYNIENKNYSWAAVSFCAFLLCLSTEHTERINAKNINNDVVPKQ